MNGCFDCKHIVCGIDREMKIPLRSLHSTNYSFEESQTTIITDELFQTKFLHENYNSSHISNYPWLSETSYIYYKNGDQSKSIAILYISNKSSKNKITIVYSHDTLTTLSSLYPTLIYLSYRLQCNIMSYDYSGFGISSGSFSPNEMISDCECVPTLLDYRGVPLSSVVLIGHTLGAVPSMYLASQFPEVKGLVLISPYTTKMENPTSLQDPNVHKNYFSEYTNDIKCDCFVIHGVMDECVNVNYTRSLNVYLNIVEKWFPTKGTHYNILEEGYLKKFAGKIKEFIEYVRKEKKEVLLNEDDDGNDNDNEEHNHNNNNIVYDDNEKSDSVGISIIQDSEKMRNDKMTEKFMGMIE